MALSFDQIVAANRSMAPASFTDQDHAFFARAATTHHKEIKASVGDAMGIVQFAAGVLGVLAVGCAAMSQDEKSS